MNEAHFLSTRTGAGAWRGFILGRAPQDPAPFQSDEIIGFDFGRRAG